MADPIYTLQTNGLAVRNDTGTISTEWWSLSPNETATIGDFYQVRATKIREEITIPVTVSGIFGEWVSLSSNQSWSINSATTNFGGVSFLIEIRDIFTNTIQASATIQLGFFDDSITGEFYYPLGDAATPLRFTYFSTAFATLDTDIPIAIGDTITFTYNANNANPFFNDVNFIESSDGVNFFGYDGATDVAQFVGYTAVQDGVTLNNGDVMPLNTSLFYPVGGARLNHTVVLTATTATDVRFIGAARIDQPIYDVTIATTAQTWIYPIDSGVTINADSNGSGNNLNVSSGLFWNDAPIMLNQGTDTTNTAPYFTINTPQFNHTADNFNYGAPTLRKDGSGNSLDTDGNTHTFGASVGGGLFLTYANGFTVEAIVKFNGVASTANGDMCGVVRSNSNSSTTALWLLGFDDFDGSAAGSGTVVPTFSVLGRNVIYDRSANQSNNVADIRGAAAVIGNTYHLLGTIRPSNNSFEFWINGVSQGSVTVSQVVMDAWFFGSGVEFGSQDIKNGVFRTIIEIGAGFLTGAFRSGQDSNLQDFKISLLEADDTFAANQAATANFTT